MYSDAEILAKAWLVREVVNLRLRNQKLEVDKMFLIGSYANGNATDKSDIDFLVQLKGGTRAGQWYPSWHQMQDINRAIKQPKIHVIYGREEAQHVIFQKYGKKYKEINLKEINDASSHRAILS